MRINMPIRWNDSLTHIDNENLDLYCAGRLAAHECAGVEAHLAHCPECQEQERLERAFRHAMVTHQDFLEAAVHRMPERRSRWSPMVWVPVGALAASLLLVLASYSWSTPSRPVDVVLLAMRGSAPQEGPAGLPFRLRLDLTGLPAAMAAQATQVDVVDGAGLVVCSGVARAEASFTVFEPERSLPAGRYWVRLYHSGKLIREYELVAR